MPNWQSGWTEEIREQALMIEWMNVLYGILETAWLIVASDRDEEHERSGRQIFGGWPILYTTINWNDMLQFVPHAVLQYDTGIQLGGYRGDESDIENQLDYLTRLSRYVQSRTQPRFESMLSLQNGPLSFHAHMIRYAFMGTKGRGLTFSHSGYDSSYVFSRDVVQIYTRLMTYYLQEMTAKNARKIMITLGLGPIITGGSKDDIEKLLPNAKTDLSLVYDALVKMGLTSVGTRVGWIGMLDKDLEDLAIRRWSSTAGRPSNKVAYIGDYVNVMTLTGEYDVMEAVVKLRTVGIYPLMNDVSGVPIVSVFSLSALVLRMGYVGKILPKLAQRAHGRINAAHLPALLHNQFILRHDRNLDLKEVGVEMFPAIVDGMLGRTRSSSIRMDSSSLIALVEILVRYNELVVDERVEAFAETILDRIDV